MDFFTSTLRPGIGKNFLYFLSGLAMVGRYNIMIENPSPDILLQVSCTVNSFPRDESYPVKMNTHAVDRDTGEITIFAEVSQGLYPVLHATLYAQERFRQPLVFGSESFQARPDL